MRLEARITEQLFAREHLAAGFGLGNRGQAHFEFILPKFIQREIVMHRRLQLEILIVEKNDGTFFECECDREFGFERAVFFAL